MTYNFCKSFLLTAYCLMRENGERVRLLSDGRKGGESIQIQTGSVYRQQLITIILARNIVSVSHPFHLWNGQIKNLRSSRSFDSMGETWTKKNEKCSKRNKECSYQILDKHKVHRGPLRGKMLSFVTHYCIELSCVWPCIALYVLLLSLMVLLIYYL